LPSYEENPDICFIPFSQEEMLVILSIDHQLAGKKALSIKDFVREPIIMREKGSGTIKLGASARPLHGIGAFMTEMTAHPK
jgi:DNA-binding transcriptional LysR family regulator